MTDVRSLPIDRTATPHPMEAELMRRFAPSAIDQIVDRMASKEKWISTILRRFGSTIRISLFLGTAFALIYVGMMDRIMPIVTTSIISRTVIFVFISFVVLEVNHWIDLT